MKTAHLQGILIHHFFFLHTVLDLVQEEQQVPLDTGIVPFQKGFSTFRSNGP